MPQTLYLRHEPTNDVATLKYGGEKLLSGVRDVAAYKDPEASKPVARWPWLYSSKPHPKRKQIVLDCVTYRDLVWLPPLNKEN